MKVSYWVSLCLISLLNGVSNEFQSEKYEGPDTILNITDTNYVGCTDYNTIANQTMVVDRVCFTVTSILLLIFLMIGFCC